MIIVFINLLGDFEWEIQGEMTEVGTSLMINDATDEGPLEVLALPPLDTISNDTGLQVAMNASLPVLPQVNGKFLFIFLFSFILNNKLIIIKIIKNKYLHLIYKFNLCMYQKQPL